MSNDALRARKSLDNLLNQIDQRRKVEAGRFDAIGSIVNLGFLPEKAEDPVNQDTDVEVDTEGDKTSFNRTLNKFLNNMQPGDDTYRG